MPMITEDQRAALEEDGYFVLENVFTAEEMDELAERIEAHQKRHQEALEKQGGTQGISRANEITFTSHLAQQDDAIRTFVMRPEFVGSPRRFLARRWTFTGISPYSKLRKEKKSFPGIRMMDILRSLHRLI